VVTVIDPPSAVERAASPAVGTLRAGTSGFAYRPWIPTFYPVGVRADGMLAYYAARLPALELNNTYYRHPRPEQVAAWLRETPPGFRFAVKAHRFASIRAFATDPVGMLPRLAESVRPFGERLAAVLWRVPQEQQRDDERLARFLGAWPDDLPLCLELVHPSWQSETVHDRLRAAGAALCVSDAEDGEEPRLVVTGPFAYLRLRRDAYDPDSLARWAERLAAVTREGRDAYVFFRHDPTGLAPARATALAELVADRSPS
jgi:uncharacterized protein YecE (DUF72 family)